MGVDCDYPKPCQCGCHFPASEDATARKPAPSYSPVYCALYPELAKVAREHGYALAVHGSLRRDFDLIAVPWVERPTEPEALVDAFTAHFALHRIGKAEPASCRSHVEEVQRVRMDPTLDPSKRLLLTAGERARVEGRLLASEAASEKEDAVAKDEAKSSMMPFRYERVAQGSLFFWGVTATCYSPLDKDTFVSMCGAFLRRAIVGGKKGTGHGWLFPVKAQDVRLANFQERSESLDLVGPDQRIGGLFHRHVKERAQEIADLLAKVAA